MKIAVFQKAGLQQACLDALQVAANFLGNLPAPKTGHPDCTTREVSGALVTAWSAHGIARAIATKLPETNDRGVNWKVADGTFGIGPHPHSWLWRHTETGATILDVMPVDGVGPRLINIEHASPWILLFKECPLAYRLKEIRRFENEADYAIGVEMAWKRQSAGPVLVG